VRGELIYGRLAQYAAAALRGETTIFEGEGEYENRHRYFQTTYIPDMAADGKVGGFYAITFDITEIKESQLELAEISNRLKLITDNMPAMISYIDAEKVFRFNNSAYEKWLDRPLESITGHRVSELYDAETYQLIEPYLDRALNGEQVAFELEPFGNRTGHVRVTYVPEIDAKGHVLGMYGLISDISELKRVERQLRILAEYDTLTGLPNRNRFKIRLSEAISRSERNDDSLAVLYLDIDHFKSINDSLGHQAGDAVLKEFARRLTQCIRQTDKLTRLAGDEFVIVLEGMHDTEETSLVAQKIIDVMTPPFDVSGQPRAISTSIGAVVRRKGELDGESLLRRADEALYAAKESGRGRFHMAP
ncbi:MAG: diguanylate cyclase domain-containing protein, partial [Arenimonas sp.]